MLLPVSHHQGTTDDYDHHCHDHHMQAQGLKDIGHKRLSSAA